MRDWLPEKARRRALVSERILRCLELSGYQRVEVPPFEYAEVLERGFGNGADSLRFVEPESGKVAVLRSDVTPQIARLIATRFPEGPWPARLCYRDSVLRRARARARLERNLLQVGFELVGPNAEAGDLEVLETATSALRAGGIEHFTVDLAHAQITGALVEPLNPGLRAEALECLAVKDDSELARVARRAGLSSRAQAALASLCELHGGAELWPRAERALSATAAAAPLASLKRIWDAAIAQELAPKIVIDLGETREFYYYTGAMFHLLAEGPGEPLGSGGRYDTLFERFDLPCPAAGFAFDVGNVVWALEARRVAEPRFIRVLVQIGTVRESGPELLRGLRARGIACAAGPEGSEVLPYARRWEFTHVLELGPGGAKLTSVEAGSEMALPAASVSTLAEVVSTHIRVIEEA